MTRPLSDDPRRRVVTAVDDEMSPSPTRPVSDRIELRRTVHVAAGLDHPTRAAVSSPASGFRANLAAQSPSRVSPRPNARLASPNLDPNTGREADAMVFREPTVSRARNLERLPPTRRRVPCQGSVGALRELADNAA